MVESKQNEQFVRISGINRMIEYGVIQIDRENLKEYTFDTTIFYNKDRFSREEGMELWYE